MLMMYAMNGPVVFLLHCRLYLFFRPCRVIQATGAHTLLSHFVKLKIEYWMPTVSTLNVFRSDVYLGKKAFLP